MEPAKIDAVFDRLDNILTRDKRWILGVVVLSFLLKLIYVIQSRDAPHVLIPILDSRFYDQMAQAIASGHVLRDEAFYLGPLYPYWLSLIYATVGEADTIVRVLQIIGGTATVWLVYVLGTAVFRPSVGFVAAIFLAFYGAMTFYEGQLLMMWLGTLLNVSLLVVLFRIKDDDRPRRVALAGFLIGLSALARASILLFLPIAIIWIVMVTPSGRRFRRGVLMLVVALLTIAPATIHNAIVSRDFVPITWNAGVNFFIGNGPGATGAFVDPAGVQMTQDFTTIDYIEQLRGEAVRPSGVSAYWFDRTFTHIGENPWPALKLIGQKIALFFNAREIAQIERYDAVQSKYAVLRITALNFWIVGTLGLIGIAMSIRKWREYLLLHGFVITYAAAIIGFFVIARYRMQVVPVMCVFAAYTLVCLFPSALKSWKRTVPLVLAVLLVAVAIRPGLFASSTETDGWGEQTRLALRYADAQQLDAALGHANAAVQIRPGDAQSYVYRALIHVRAGDLQAAIVDYSRALELDPNRAQVHFELASALARVNDFERAVDHLRRAIDLNPSNVSAHNNIGLLFMRMNRTEDAAEHFEEAVRRNPRYMEARVNLGVCYTQAGRHNEAIRVFEATVEMDPGFATAYRNLAAAYLDAGRREEAREALRQYVTLRPNDTDARRILNRLDAAP